MVIVVAMCCCVAAVSPLEYGLRKSRITGKIDGTPVQGGLHLCAPWQDFLTFPATRVTLEWSNSAYADRPQVSTRTGADPKDPDSGGQPIGISSAIQYALKPST
jgi:hypothetical protein